MKLPSSLVAHHLHIDATVSVQLELNEHVGAALRGAFFEALWGRFCVNKQAQTCADCPLVNACPVGSLVAPLRDEAPRGRDVPRPYAIRPPVDHARTFTPGEPFSFGLTLFGCRLDLFPYVAMALQLMAQSGIGRRTQENNWRRGRFSVDEIQAINLLSGKDRVTDSPACYGTGQFFPLDCSASILKIARWPVGLLEAAVRMWRGAVLAFSEYG